MIPFNGKSSNQFRLCYELSEMQTVIDGNAELFTPSQYRDGTTATSQSTKISIRLSVSTHTPDTRRQIPRAGIFMANEVHNHLVLPIRGQDA